MVGQQCSDAHTKSELTNCSSLFWFCSSSALDRNWPAIFPCFRRYSCAEYGFTVRLCRAHTRGLAKFECICCDALAFTTKFAISHIRITNFVGHICMGFFAGWPFFAYGLPRIGRLWLSLGTVFLAHKSKLCSSGCYEPITVAAQLSDWLNRNMFDIRKTPFDCTGVSIATEVA